MIRLSAFIIMALLAGCSAQPKCYVEVGVGVWTYADDIPGYTPSEANAFCQKGPWSAGLYHRSDIGRGFPFNDQEESSTDALMVKYRTEIRDFLD